MRVLLFVCLFLLLSACYMVTAHEPAICTDERWDTTTTIAEGQTYYVRPRCEVWRALSDSTMCWDAHGVRVRCP